jgi:YVTN family beta-propeller protein
MRTFDLRVRGKVWAALSLATVALPLGAVAYAQSYSSPIALAPDEALLWVVNPGDDSVTIIDTATNQALSTIPVGDDPRSIAIDPRNRYALVANAAGNSITVLRIIDETPEGLEIVPDNRVGPGGALITGAEPWSVAISPDGRRAFVANSGQDTITVLDVRAAGGPQILGQVDLRRSHCNSGDLKRHFQPRGLAVSADNTQLYTARFLSFTPKNNGVQVTTRARSGWSAGSTSTPGRPTSPTTSPAGGSSSRPRSRASSSRASPRIPRGSPTSCRAS